jgi:hypothetical protein
MNQIIEQIEFVNSIKAHISNANAAYELNCGAYGKYFVLELSPTQNSNQILKRILVDIDSEEKHSCVNKMDVETLCVFSDAAHFVSLIKLLELEFECKTQIMQPFDDNGDDLPDLRRYLSAAK